ncbi:MAG: hypothetical protein LBK58_14520 [Prevotellaceae bacterium]|jgi:hypothetical protein|nr:hypothetical protein [Prevotellaceae bacterium]
MWKLFAGVNNWHTWDKGIEFARLEGKFEAGNLITLCSQGGPNVKIELPVLIENERFLSVTKFPLAKMYDDHLFEETDSGLKILFNSTIFIPVDVGSVHR